MEKLFIFLIIFLAIAVPAGVIIFMRMKSAGKIDTGWTLDTYSTNVKLEVTGDQYSFQFPSAYPGVHSIMKHVDGLKSGSHVKVTWEIAGQEPQFVADGDTPTVGLYLGGARIYTSGPYRVPLAVGRRTVIFPVVPEAWQTVDGKSCAADAAARSMFEKSLTAKTLGLCFGDNHGFAHGVNLKSGSARFHLIEFTLQP